MWISHPEIYRVYHPAYGPIPNPNMPASHFLAMASGKRVWMATTQETSGNGEAYGNADRLRGAGYREVLRQRFRSMDVILFEPPSSSQR